MAKKDETASGPRWMTRAKRPPEFVPGKVVVRFKSDALLNVQPSRAVRSFRSVLPEQVSGPLEMLSNQFGLRRVEPVLAPQRRMAALGGFRPVARSVASLAASVTDSPRERLRGYNVVELQSTHLPSKDALKRIEASEAVEHVELVPNRWTSAAAIARPDPKANWQWGLRAIDWFNAKRPDARKVHVAVLDTGVDREHPDLKGSIEAYHPGSYSLRDMPGHGTHVAGIIAARTNNGIGISGVANCRLHVWKVFGDPKGKQGEEFDDEAYNRALGAVLDSPARILNLSLGGTAPSRLEQDLIAALVSEGVLVVAAMGNAFEEGNPVEYPAAYADVLAVGAIDEARKRAYFSSTGMHLGVMAPGNGILSTLPRYPAPDRVETEYAAWPGTSMAAPHVAACAALLKVKYNKNGSWIANRLKRTAVPLPGMKGKKFTKEFGHGLVNIFRAL